MDYRTIVKNEDWEGFAEELNLKSSMKFELGVDVVKFNPFEDSVYWHYCALDMDADDGTLNLAKNIDAEVELLSNEEFINLCFEKFPKESRTFGDIGCFVERNLWSIFVDILQEFSSVKWVEGQKPKEFVPTSLDVGFVFLGLGKVVDGIGIYTQKPDFVSNVVTKTEFIHQCCKQFPKN